MYTKYVVLIWIHSSTQITSTSSTLGIKPTHWRSNMYYTHMCCAVPCFSFNCFMFESYMHSAFTLNMQHCEWHLVTFPFFIPVHCDYIFINDLCQQTSCRIVKLNINETENRYSNELWKYRARDFIKKTTRWANERNKEGKREKMKIKSIECSVSANTAQECISLAFFSPNSSESFIILSEGFDIWTVIFMIMLCHTTTCVPFWCASLSLRSQCSYRSSQLSRDTYSNDDYTTFFTFSMHCTLPLCVFFYSLCFCFLEYTLKKVFLFIAAFSVGILNFTSFALRLFEAEMEIFLQHFSALDIFMEVKAKMIKCARSIVHLPSFRSVVSLWKNDISISVNKGDKKNS